MQTQMKVMKYSKDYKMPREILFANIYKGYQFYIMNLGMGPTAYIEIPKTHKLYGKRYNDDDFDDLNVHGGVTFTEDHLIISDVPYQRIENTWFIGWDYMHYNDYIPMYDNFSTTIRMEDLKRWTTDEIFENVKSAIDELIEIDAK